MTRQALVLAAALLAVLAAGTGVARLFTEPGPGSAQQVVYSCQEWPIMVCVHPGMHAGLPELGSAFIKIASRLAGTPGEFSRLEQHPRRDQAPLAPGTVPIHVDDLAAGFAERAADEFVEGLGTKCEGTSASGYRDIVIAWLRGKPLPGGPLPEHQYAAAWFSGLTEDQRRDWLRLYYADFTECRLQSTHFGGQAEADHSDSAAGPGAGGGRGAAPADSAGRTVLPGARCHSPDPRRSRRRPRGSPPRENPLRSRSHAADKISIGSA